MNHRRLILAALVSLAPTSLLAQAPAAPVPAPRPAGPRAEPSPQPRPHGRRVAVEARFVSVDDGDSVVIKWGAGDEETVRILGIDTPETRHIPHDLPYAQAFGPEARAFAMGVFAMATQVELLRASTLDPFGRTLGYLFVNGRNYSVLVLEARLAEESVTRYGDNGFPQEAAACVAAAKAAGPLAFEPPGAYRARMRELSRAMKARGEYPEQ
jgi:endonuclease YncB( thermonuclease family)